MFGWNKAAKKLWPNCIIHEFQGNLEVFSKGHEELLVCAKSNGTGAVLCAQAESKAKYPLEVLQAPGNAEKHGINKKAAPAQ